jgi:site-specific DNA recombinase
LVTEESFARAQELLSHNKIRSLRRTIAPSVVQGLVGCAKCGYALSRTSTQTSARKIHYYKCIGSDSWRKLGGPVCDNNRFIRQELLDQIVWAEVVRLLQDPALIQQELDRRLAAARTSDPTRKREQSLQRELSQVDKGIERLLTAYQEELLSLEQLRERMPMLRQRQQALRAELQAITDQANDRAAFLRLAETLTAFLTRLRSASESLSVMERQKIVRLLVKEILVGEDTITIRHSIPIPSAPPQNGGSEALNGQHYLLCKGRDHRPLRTTCLRVRPFAFLHHPSVEPLLDQPQEAGVSNAMLHELDQPTLVEVIEKSSNVGVQNIVHLLLQERIRQRIQCLMLAAPRAKSIRESEKILLINLVEDGNHGLLGKFVFQSRDR